ncbi:hypothetical protein JOF29_003269 [Kribbella aluminosa]|uniref:Uncharacterized protein n=1 Tax=Kribbella aluminosa TaxID=416017 RepID=A0ABS4UKK9_9ACTN|nr:hypothetical protein [Kribbella aluminosa]MBP2352186.1 hypothetical protein [Kribbella aluminosa]
MQRFVGPEPPESVSLVHRSAVQRCAVDRVAVHRVAVSYVSGSDADAYCYAYA